MIGIGRIDLHIHHHLAVEGLQWVGEIVHWIPSGRRGPSIGGPENAAVVGAGVDGVWIRRSHGNSGDDVPIVAHVGADVAPAIAAKIGTPIGVATRCRFEDAAKTQQQPLRVVGVHQQGVLAVEREVRVLVAAVVGQTGDRGLPGFPAIVAMHEPGGCGRRANGVPRVGVQVIDTVRIGRIDTDLAGLSLPRTRLHVPPDQVAGVFQRPRGILHDTKGDSRILRIEGEGVKRDGIQIVPFVD